MKFLHLNVNSIQKYKHELITTFNDVDCFSLNETKLSPSFLSFNLTGFEVFRLDRNSRGGGVIIAIRHAYQSTLIETGILDGSEYVIIECKRKQRQPPLIIASIYVPPNRTINILLLRKIQLIRKNFLILGDFNASHIDWNCSKTNKNGRILFDWVHDDSISIIGNSDPTFENNDSVAKLDWIFTDFETELDIHDYTTHPSLGTTTMSHRPITFILQDAFEQRSATTARKQLAFHKANWSLYRIELDRLLRTRPPEAVTKEIDLIQYNSFLTDCINRATDLAIPPASSLVRTNPVKPSTTTLRLIQMKHHLYRKMKKESNNTMIKTEFYRLRHLVQNALLNDRKESFIHLMKNLSGPPVNSSRMWSTVNRFKSSRISRKITHSLTFSDTTACFDQEKVDLFRSYFTQVYAPQPNLCQQQIDIDKYITDEIDRFNKRTCLLFPKITLEELVSIIRSLGNTAVGNDGVHNRCLKNGTKLLFRHLLELFNSSLSLGVIPHAWKVGHIILLPKPDKNLHDVRSYRPITLLSCLGKLLERIVKSRLSLFAESNQLLPMNQAGFRRGKSTTDNLLHLTHDIHAHLHRSRQTGLVVFDIKQAFDSVWHNGLLFKLKQLHIPDYLWRWCQQFVTNRQSLIEINSYVSESFVLCRGTPQGSPLSPLLFILYTHDCLLNIPRHTISNLFADDTALWSSSSTTRGLGIRLQESIDAFTQWCYLWKFEIQGEKTKLLRFTNHPRKKYPPLQLFVNKIPVIEAVSLKYLGVVFDKTLSFTQHAKEIRKRINPRLGLLNYLSRNVDAQGERALLLVYHSLIRSVLTYASPIFMLANRQFWDTMQTVQNKALRLALHLPSYTSSAFIHQQSHQKTIFNYSKEQTIAYMNRAIQHGNTRIMNIIKDTITLKQQIRLPLTDFLADASSG